MTNNHARLSLSRRVLAGLLGADRNPAPAPDTTEILGRCLTLGGAEVHITAYDNPRDPRDRTWACTGFGCNTIRITVASSVRAEVNEHASTCRFVPGVGGAR